MKAVIIDSGLGGLSVCAFLEKALNQARLDSIEIKYVNAVPQDDLGYNQMETRIQKIETFNQVLDAIEESYHPDFIFVACNTLSALIEETAFSQKQPIPSLEGMIHLGTALLFKLLSDQSTAGVFIFATETTIEEAVYANHLQSLGIEPHRIFSQAFPGVATLISNDLQGDRVYLSILKYTQQALKQISSPFEPLYAYLGCTHYGYRQAFFQKAFEASNYPSVALLNPNQAAAEKILSKIMGTPNKGAPSFPISIEFLSRYALPATEVTTLSHFLSQHSVATAEALQNYTLNPDLF